MVEIVMLAEWRDFPIGTMQRVDEGLGVRLEKQGFARVLRTIPERETVLERETVPERELIARPTRGRKRIRKPARDELSIKGA